VAVSKWRQDFLKGVGDAIPFGVTFFFVFMAIGAAYRAAGIDSFITTLATVIVFSAPSQLATMDFLSDGAWIQLLLATIIVNGRLTFMTAALLPYLTQYNRTYLSLTMCTISTSTFALTFSHCKTAEKPNALAYYLGTALSCFPISIAGTYAGSVFAGSLSSTNLIFLKMLLPIYFVHLLAKSWPEKRPIVAGAVGFALAPPLEYIVPSGGLILSAIFTGIVMVLVDDSRPSIVRG
jgi:predicted branched-subunit amino acid permease